MKLVPTSLALSLALLAGSASASPLSQANAGLLPIPANRIVGLWEVNATVAPCLGGQPLSFVALNTFHAGGTLSDINALPPTSRASGQGVWAYKLNNRYETRFQFLRFQPDGSYDGIQDIRTTMTLNRQATQYDATVRVRVLNTDGSLRVELCGHAAGRRVSL